ncbi:hypothetical protein BS47DRAFT_1393319 [Hydnum rufescens UP504]|uniref:Uncharacterized protein n=1 Tax=Hydnum rufescens UP504 TaxID=1448309 RepID=A0A9P6DW82_9AGAM|nr:hypothetical protein BS47DRAFT_1393319 [Hydnum rufescens UP504]
MWEKESDEVCVKIQNVREAQYKEAMAEYNQVQLVCSQSPEQFQNAIDHIYPYLQQVATVITEHTRFMISIIVRGPSPAAKGEIVTSHIHKGEISGDHLLNFGSYAHDIFANVVMPKFIKFVNQVFPQDIQDSRSLMPAKSLTPEVALLEAAADGAATVHKAKEFSAENDLEDKDRDADDSGADNKDSDSSDHNSKDEHVTFNHYSCVVSHSPTPANQRHYGAKHKACTSGVSGMQSPPRSKKHAVIETLPDPAVLSLQDSAILLSQDSVAPLLRDSTVPSLQEAIVPSLRDSTAPSLLYSPIIARLYSPFFATRLSHPVVATLCSPIIARLYSPFVDSMAPSLQDPVVLLLQDSMEHKRPHHSIPKSLATVAVSEKSSIDTAKTLGAEESWYAQHLEHADLLVASKHCSTLLANWASLKEDLANSKENSPSRLTSKNRPIAIHDWVKHARSPTWMPDLSDAKGLKAYGDKWHEWWAACQPTWRVKKPNSNEFLPSNGQGDWSILRIGGNNGLLLHVMALAWWGNVSLHDVKETKWWTAAVKEVSWVLGHMLTSHRK